jgi:glycosyltransferase involved in cell wall biosynthesis
VVSSALPGSELIDGFVKGRVSVVMPAYNEASKISRSVNEIRNLFEKVCLDFEIVVVDDGSLDDTRAKIGHLQDDSVRCVGYEKNQGKGHALKEGFQFVTGQYTFFIDSDSEVRATELRDYVEALGSSDIAIGSKRHPLSTVRTPPIRRFLSVGFNLLERILTGVRATDTQAGFKAARSTALYRILPLLSVKRYAFDAELLAVASLLGYRIRELPVCVELGARFSPRQVFRMYVDLMGIAYRLRITRWYQQNIRKMTTTYKPIIRW